MRDGVPGGDQSQRLLERHPGGRQGATRRQDGGQVLVEGAH